MGHTFIAVSKQALLLLAILFIASCDDEAKNNQKTRVITNGGSGDQLPQDSGSKSVPSTPDSTGDSANPAPGSSTDTGNQPTPETPSPGENPAPQNCKLTIVSDLDDTIKQTNTLDPSDTVTNSFSSPKSFTGLNTIYNKMAVCKGSEARLEIVSATPAILKSKVEDFLKKFDFSSDKIYLRGVADLLDSKAYKLASIDKIASQQKDDTFIFIGDDTQDDPVVYSEWGAKYPNRVTAIYIHRIKSADGALPAGQLSFHTALDIALEELKQKRMEESDVSDVLDVLHKESDFRNIIPDFAACPLTKPSCDVISTVAIADQCKLLADKLWTFCEAREK